MKVRATARGYLDQIREPGDEFEVPDDTGPATWFERVDGKPIKEPKQAKPKPDDKGDGKKAEDLA
ncbi:hypothetical protein CAL26_09975 [Bordetella genomosp. 9]|uniref:DUF2635 domain-containing protein n=1 Tax=Bordetella genomosp. 9 TaxID=1416803 RepID=A0A261RFD2_9BORD|nr:hypothetical protein [Bordetella genomosp. 9]OZI23748.1 hypothetical protein CAL26_09975 [Bordetella genomosp. 9]